MSDPAGLLFLFNPDKGMKGADAAIRAVLLGLIKLWADGADAGHARLRSGNLLASERAAVPPSSYLMQVEAGVGGLEVARAAIATAQEEDFAISVEGPRDVLARLRFRWSKLRPGHARGMGVLAGPPPSELVLRALLGQGEVYVDAGDFLAEAAPRVEALGWKLCKMAEGMLDPMAELDWEEFRQTARALEEH